MFIALGYSCVRSSEFMFSSNDEATGEDKIVTSLGDVFTIKYEKLTFPEEETMIEIYDITNKEMLNGYREDGDYIRPKFEVVINTKELRCYRVNFAYIYKIRGSKFKEIKIGELQYEHTEVTSELVYLSKELLKCSD